MTSEPVDPIGQVLRHLQVTGIFYCPCELTEPWGLSLPPMEGCVWFHVVTDGVATLEVDGEELSCRTGDLVLVPHGTGHRAWGREPASTPSVLDLPHDHVGDRYAVLRHGAGGDLTQVVCGGVRFEQPAAHHLLDALPAVVRVDRSEIRRADWLRATLDLIADETQQVRPGADAVVSRLCDIVVIQALRAWIERDPGARGGWLGALRDEQVGAAIAAVHADPAHPWTVGSLAAHVAMSRSAFAARFTDLVGEPVMGYVTRWRMLHAHDLLAGGASVAAAARQVGYESEAAFSRAFTRTIGSSPGVVRAGGLDAPAVGSAVAGARSPT